MTSDDIIELIAQLRAMARCEHEDMTVVVDAAAEIERLRARVEELENLRLVVVAETADAKTLDRDDAIIVLQMLRRAALKETAP